MAASDEHAAQIERARAMIDRLRRKGEVRGHFHAGAMAAITALTDLTASTEAQVDAIQKAQDAYVDRVCT